VEDEIVCLQRLWRPDAERGAEPTVALDALMGREGASQVDLFDAMQLEAVIKVCRQSKSLSDAGRKLYGMSRDAKSTPNDADRPVNPGGGARGWRVLAQPDRHPCSWVHDPGVARSSLIMPYRFGICRRKKPADRNQRVFLL
jgi:hypothetical protein